MVVHAPEERGFSYSHERASRAGIAKKLAAIKGFAFAGEYDPSAHYAGQVYFVPSETLDFAEAAQLGISSEQDLFGGVVPHHFVATKAITHPLVAADALAPIEWSPAFESRVRASVLRGFTAFQRDDARIAGERLLERGSVRIKPVKSHGGCDQIVVSTHADLVAAVDAVDEAELAKYGLVLEENLAEVTTFSVGQVRVAALLATYVGTQCLTTNNSGVEVYGGSDLLVVRGDFDALIERDLDSDMRLAVEQARVYDTAAIECFPGMYMSRRNYDVAAGLDAALQRKCGVLEQSWRIGGASGAEVAALEAFHADPSLRAVRTACYEIYGADVMPPPDATVYFHGVDEQAGLLTKYTLVKAYDYSR